MTSIPSRRIDSLGDLLRIRGRAVDAVRRSVRIEREAEFRRDHDVVAPAGERAADELLVRIRPVHLGRIEEGHAELERPVNRRDRLGVITRAVGERHAHAAEADRPDRESLRSKRPCLHDGTIPRGGFAMEAVSKWCHRW